MALKLKIVRNAVNSVGTEMYLIDATGDYSAENLGGWGAPNPERTAKALLIETTYHESEKDTAVELYEYDPETVENFTVKCTADGYYEIVMVAVDKFTPIVEGNYGWTSIGGLTQLSGGVLVPKTPNEVFADALFLDGVSFKTVLLSRLAINRNDLNLQLVKLLLQHNDDRGHNRDIVDITEKHNEAKALLDGAKYQWCLDNYTYAQRIVESSNAYKDGE
jgi:hypothetical protein